MEDFQGAFTKDERGIVRSSLLARGINALHVDLLDHGYFYGDESWNQFGVVSPFARLYFMAKDYGWVETESGRVDLNPGQMYLIPPYEKVNLRTDHRLEKFYLHLNCHYAGLDMLENIRGVRVLPMEQSELGRLLQAYEGQNVQDLLQFKSQIYAVMGQFIGFALPDLHERLLLAEHYKDVHKYVRNHISFQLGYRDVAGALGLSADVLRVSYATDMGVTLSKHIQGQLIQQAALRLLQGQKSIKEVAAELGFNDEFYFSRFFKKRMQYSPRAYRRLNGSELKAKH